MALEGESRDAVGIVLQIIATFLAALAYVLQKKAHRSHDAHHDGTIGDGASTTSAKPNVYRNPLWISGFALLILVAGIDTYAFTLLDQTKLAAFAAVTLAWNVILASLFLKEPFTRLDALSCVVISAGTILAIASADATSQSFTLPQILARLHDDFVYAYSAIVAIFIAIAAWTIKNITRRQRKTWSRVENGIVGMLSPCLGGMCMGFTGYGAKAISSVVFDGEWSELADYPIYLYALLTGCALFCQVRYLNTGLKYFDAIAVVPIFETFIIISNSMSGIVFYGDLRGPEESDLKRAGYGIGLVIAIAGVCINLKKAGGYVASANDGVDSTGAYVGVASNSSSGAASPAIPFASPLKSAAKEGNERTRLLVSPAPVVLDPAQASYLLHANAKA